MISTNFFLYINQLLPVLTNFFVAIWSFYRDKSDSKNRRFKAVYSYTQNNNDELTLSVGDVIEFLGEVEEGWWRGKLSGKTGVFPSNFVEVCAEASPVLVNRRSSNNSEHKTNIASARNGKSTENTTDERHDSSASVTNDKDAPSLPPKPGKLTKIDEKFDKMPGSICFFFNVLIFVGCL